MLELIARGGMRVGEVLKITPNDVEDRKVFMRNPKSGKEMEVAFIPKKVGDRLKEYINRIAFSRLPKFTIDIGNIASGICQN